MVVLVLGLGLLMLSVGDIFVVLTVCGGHDVVFGHELDGGYVSQRR